MIKVIFGEKGTGKTKRMLQLANSAAKTATGSLVFIDDDNRYMFDLDHCVRFINATDYSINSPKMFYGFICGLMASDFDLEYLFADGFLSVIKHDLGTLEGLFTELNRLSEQRGVNIIISVSGGLSSLPPFMRDMVLE